MLNHIVLMGRLTRDPELRYTQSQTPVASFSLAVDRDFGRGEEKQTDFIDCVAWRQTGEFVSKYFQKGSMAVVSGRLQICLLYTSSFHCTCYEGASPLRPGRNDSCLLYTSFCENFCEACIILRTAMKLTKQDRSS